MTRNRGCSREATLENRSAVLKRYLRATGPTTPDPAARVVSATKQVRAVLQVRRHSDRL